MTKNTILVTCDACRGWGVLDTGCDIQGLTRCNHCGGAGTIETEVADATAEVEDESIADAAAIDEFKTYIAACQLTAKVRLETATDLTPNETMRTDEVFQKASLVLLYIEDFETTSNPIERLNITISSILKLEEARFDSAQCMLDVLAEHSTPAEKMRYYADVANRGEESFKWFNITMAKLLEVKAKYGIKFEETPKATNFNPFQ